MPIGEFLKSCQYHRNRNMMLEVNCVTQAGPTLNQELQNIDETNTKNDRH